MDFKKILCGTIAYIMVFSSIPQNIVFGEDFNVSKDSIKDSNNNVDESSISKNGKYNELVEQRTFNTKTFTNGSGQFYKEIFAEPVHIKTKNKYEEIDNSLSTNKDEEDTLTTENTSLQAEFPKQLQTDNGIVFKRGLHQVEFELNGATQQDNKINPNFSSKVTLENNKVLYNEVYPNVDLRHITFNEEVKEDWIIKKYTGINQFTYTLRTKLVPILQTNGSLEFFSKVGEDTPVFTLPAPEMMDSNIDEGKGEGTYSKRLKYLLEKNQDDSYKLILDIDKEWLASSSRKYPVYVDPSVSIETLGDTYISSKYPTMNYNKKWDPVQGEYVLQTGYYDSTSGTNYAFIKFSVANELKGAVIDTATLQAYVTHAYYATQKTGLWIDEANSKWATNEVNWNNKPSSTKISSSLVGRDEWAKLDVKSTLQAWVSEDRPNTGFKLHTNGNGKTYWKKITASESENKPKLVISYHYDQMPIPTMTSQLDNASLKSGSVKVNWKSVLGASSYKLQMFDGYRYETIYSGNALSWTSRDKKIFPKAPFSSSSRYKLDGTGTELPVDPSAFYSANLGSATTAKAYKFRVIPVYPTGDGPSSTIISKEIPVPAGEPDLPTVTTGTYGEADTINKGRGWLNVKWNKVANATGYKVRIWNGSVYKNYTVGKDTTSISTKGKKIWPTDDQIKAGITELHDVNFDDTSSIAKGAELPIDPSATYGSSSSRYSVRVIATSAAGDSPSSDVNYGYMKLYAPKTVSITANDDNLVQNKTSLTMKWSPSVGANYYEVQLNNGTSIEKYKVKGTTSFTTPKTTYELGKMYTANVVAFFDDDDTAYESEEDKISGQRGLSDKSTTAVNNTSLRADLNGIEDYFSYDQKEFGNASAFINVTTGNVVLQFSDKSLYTRSGLGYTFKRTFNSRSNKISAFGTGWTFVGNESLKELTNGDIEYEDEDGTQHIFKKDGTNYSSPKGLYETLIKNDKTFMMTDKFGFTQIYQFDSTSKSYLISSYLDVSKNEIVFKRNINGQLIEVFEKSNADGIEKIKISYIGNLIDKISYGDNWTKYEYSNNRLSKTIVGSNNTSKTIVESFDYNADNQLIKYLDGKNNQTTLEYNNNEIIIFDKQSVDAELSVTNKYQLNPKDNEYKVIDSSDNETMYKRDLKNNTFAVIEESIPSDTDNHQTAQYYYDSQYNLLKIVDYDGNTTITEYDESGNATKINTQEGIETNTYDSKNRLLSTSRANGEKIFNEYKDNLLSKSTINNEETSYEYDLFGREKKVTYPNGTFETTEYDDSKRKIISTDKKGNSSSVSYSMFGQKLNEEDSEGNTKAYEYDDVDSERMISVIDGKNNKTFFEYDNNNNLKVVIDPLSHKKEYVYNNNDQIIEAKLPNMLFRYSYDDNGELSQSILPSGITTNYSYNNSGLLEQVESEDEKIEYQYDDKGNNTSVLKNGNILKTFNYSTENNQLNKYSLNLFNQTYAYDDNERNVEAKTSYSNDFIVSQKNSYSENSDDIKDVSYSLGGSIIHQFKNTVDNTKNILTISLNDGVLKQQSQMNDSNLLESITYTTKIQDPFKIFYEYSKNGKILKMTSGDQTSKYEYDSNEQLIQETQENGEINSYEYDALGNRTKSKVNNKEFNFSYNDSNQILEKNNNSYDYDVDGNLVKDENFKYFYDKQQNLIKVESLDGKLIASYTYDESGLRLSKTIKEKTYEYFYTDDVLDMEVVKINGDVSEYKLYEWNEYTPLGMIVKKKNSNGGFSVSPYHFITNHRGDILSIRDQEDNIVATYEYDAFGNVLKSNGEMSTDNSIRYAGYYYDQETKNYYLQARYYNPENAVFMALDPNPGDIEDPLSQNGYTYTQNNPLTHIDPDGHQRIVKGAQVIIKGGKWLWKSGKKAGKWAWKKSKKAYKKFNMPKPKFSDKSLQKKYNSHKEDFGMKGNYNKKQKEKFKEKLKSHIKNANEIIQSKYHGKKVYVYIRGKVGVLLDTEGNFISGWKLSKEQLNYHRTHGFRIK